MSPLIRMLSVFAVTVGVAACADGIPAVFAPDKAPIRSDLPATFARSGTVRGRASITVRRLDPTSRLGSVVKSDTASYTAEIQPNGDGMATVDLPDGTVRIAIGQQVRKGHGRSWQRVMDSRLDGAKRTIHTTARAGLPVEESEVRRNGVLISSNANTWRRRGAGWWLSETVTTVYDRGQPVMSVTMSFEDGAVVESAALNHDDIARLPADMASYSGEGACESEIAAMDVAFASYEASVLAVWGCGAGPWACFALVVNLGLRAHLFDLAVDRAQQCLAAY